MLGKLELISDFTVFVVPHTPDMLTSIFHPKKPKTALDILTIVSLVLQIVLFFPLRGNVRRGFFVVYFAFWRGAYNGGLGYILKAQSEREWIVKTVKRQGWLDAKRRPKVYDWAKHHLVMKMDKDYDFDALPLEYNVWLLFRSIVDVILLNDVRLWSFLFPSVDSSLQNPVAVCRLFALCLLLYQVARGTQLRYALASLDCGLGSYLLQPLGQDGCPPSRQGLCMVSALGPLP